VVQTNVFLCGLLVVFSSLSEGQEEYDPRDINRVRDDLNYVYKFAWQHAGDEMKAYKLLVCDVLDTIVFDV